MNRAGAQRRSMDSRSGSAALALKRLMFPGSDLSIRKRMRLTCHFRTGDISTLDAGCGNGAFSLAAYRLRNRVLGINIDPTQVRKCREYAAYIGVDPGRLRFEVGNIYKVGGLNSTFDQIICLETLEHLLHDQAVVNGLASVLNPDGLLHLCTPNSDCPINLYDLSTYEDGRHVRAGYTHAGLEALTRAAGLEPIRRDAYGGCAVQAAVKLQRWLSAYVRPTVANTP